MGYSAEEHASNLKLVQFLIKEECALEIEGDGRNIAAPKNYWFHYFEQQFATIIAMAQYNFDGLLEEYLEKKLEKENHDNDDLLKNR